MKSVSIRTFTLLFIVFAALMPDMLVTVAQAQTKSFGDQLVDSLGIFIAPFSILVIGGFTLIIYNGIAVRKKAFVKDDVVQSRVIWLEGLELGKNKGNGVDSFQRYIYIHGTPEEWRLGSKA